MSDQTHGRDGLPIMPRCHTCGRRKAPQGRDVAAGRYCHPTECQGYHTGPVPSSYWSADEPPRPDPQRFNPAFGDQS